MKKYLNFPGSNFLIPMFLTAIVYTFVPDVLTLGYPFSGLFTQDATFFIISTLLIVSGIQTDLRKLPKLMTSIGTVIVIKIMIVLLVTQLWIVLFPISGVFQITALSIVSVLMSCNPGMYLVLLGEDITSIEKSGFSLVNLLMLPVLPLILISVGQSKVDILIPILTSLLPFLIGIVIGELFPKSRNMFAPLSMLLIPFLAVTFGARINLLNAFHSIGSGIILLILFYLVLVFPLSKIDDILNDNGGRVSLSMHSVAAFSMSIPPFIATYIPEWQPYVSQSVTQIAFVVIISSFLTPFLYKKLITKNN